MPLEKVYCGTRHVYELNCVNEYVAKYVMSAVAALPENTITTLPAVQLIGMNKSLTSKTCVAGMGAYMNEPFE